MKKSDIFNIKVGAKIRFISNPYQYLENYQQTNERVRWIIGAIDLFDNKSKIFHMSLGQFTAIQKIVKSAIDPNSVDFEFKSFDKDGWEVEYSVRELTDIELEMKNSFDSDELKEYVDKLMKFQTAFL